jgi:hypothetical protein
MKHLISLFLLIVNLTTIVLTAAETKEVSFPGGGASETLSIIFGTESTTAHVEAVDFTKPSSIKVSSNKASAMAVIPAITSKGLSRLTHLDLTGNYFIGDEGAIALARALPGVPLLSHLDLTLIYLDVEATAALKAVRKHRPELEIQYIIY